MRRNANSTQHSKRGKGKDERWGGEAKFLCQEPPAQVERGKRRRSDYIFLITRCLHYCCHPECLLILGLLKLSAKLHQLVKSDAIFFF